MFKFFSRTDAEFYILRTKNRALVFVCLLSLLNIGCGNAPKENPEASKSPESTKDVPVIDSVFPNSGAGKQQTFTVTVSDEVGSNNVQVVQLLFNSKLNNVGGCSVYRNTAGLYLFNDLATVLEGPSKKKAMLKNAQCTVSEAESSFTGSGKTRTATFAVTFSNTFQGPKHMYAYAVSASGRNTGFLDRGVWQAQ